MTFAQAMKSLRSNGTAQNRKVYGRHGVSGPMFGVSFAHLGKLSKQIKQDHELAMELWESGNHDAQVLAAMIADPARLKSKVLDGWAKALGNYCLADILAKLVSRSPLAKSKMGQWQASSDEFIGQAGWSLAAVLAMDGGVSDDECKQMLERIEKEIHEAPNRTKHAMNNALIAIGGSRPKLMSRAIEAARRIGKVEVDHGQTGCKTPEAIPYIQKMVERRPHNRKSQIANRK